MRLKTPEPSRRSNRLKDQAVVASSLKAEPPTEGGTPGPRTRGLLPPTPRDPIRRGTRGRRSGIGIQEPTIDLKQLKISVQKIKEEPEILSVEKAGEGETPSEAVAAGVQKPFPLLRTRGRVWEPSGHQGPGSVCGGHGVWALALALMVVVGVWYTLDERTRGQLWAPWNPEPCGRDCRMVLVESVPVGVRYPPGSPSLPPISQAWLELLTRANSSLDIAAFYVTLRDSNQSHPSAAQGRRVFESLSELPGRGVRLRIAVNGPQKHTADTGDLGKSGAEVREVDLGALTGGVIHTKLWAVDRSHVYIGSANMDWRSLTQVKELGVVVTECGCLARDVERVFDVYWGLGAPNAPLPPSMPGTAPPSRLRPPLQLHLNGLPAQVSLSTSPPTLGPPDLRQDLDAILHIISDAKEHVYISVMDFLPLCQYSQPQRFWPPLDDALRRAGCERGVEVRLLVGCWQHSHPSMYIFLQSLTALSHQPLQCPITVKVFQVPAGEEEIPFSRVNHNKFMVTDRVAYIGTSNWSGDYFTRTAGVGLTVNQSDGVPGDPGSVRRQLEAVFLRDWNSEYARKLSDSDLTLCGPQAGGE
ncbi:5'-3' exonuclease PLD3 [Callorhinchus milii]|uniref:5'-3' exonuclease PLD3 n=1 Tax=Callorhinchus milii TaxID=7868 RepID=UPI001C3F9C24|nr:5'-3' exonuclease PLD3 [Callorhinchus milii]